MDHAVLVHMLDALEDLAHNVARVRFRKSPGSAQRVVQVATRAQLEDKMNLLLRPGQSHLVSWADHVSRQKVRT